MGEAEIQAAEGFSANGAAKPAAGRKPDDADMMFDLVKSWKGKVAHFYGNWQVYQNGCWQVRQPPKVRSFVLQFLLKYRERGIAINSARVNSVTNLAEDACYISDDELMQQAEGRKQYINLQNGLYNLETHQIEKHQADLYFTNQLPFSYQPDANCPTLHRFLTTSLVDESGKPDFEMIALVQEAMAYSMTARTDLKASFWCVGKPDSGKSTLIALLRSLMGSLHATIDLNQLGNNRFLLSGIVGKRVVTFTEASAGSVIPDALYKTMVGGQDEVWADVKNKPGIAFKPESKFWWAMNDAPRTTDRSGAVLNRLHVLLFNRTIPQNQRIHNLDSLLAQELPGIFNWLMSGYKRLVRAGTFTRPTQSEKWRESYQLDNDTEASFIAARCKRVPTAYEPSQPLYDTYRTWCIDGGFTPRNQNNFARDMERLGFEKRERDGRKYWYGLQIMR